MIDVINKAWGWMQIVAEEIEEINEFGNVIFKDVNGKYWRLCPEELKCELVALDEKGLKELKEDAEFQEDWKMQKLVDLAREELGQLLDDQVYCLKFPPVLGGLYDKSNLGTIPLGKLIAFSGEMAFQIKDLPDGAKIKINIEGLE